MENQNIYRHFSRWGMREKVDGWGNAFRETALFTCEES